MYAAPWSLLRIMVSFLQFTVPELLVGLVNTLRINNEVASEQSSLKMTK